ncbi:MAG: FimB/Mfa2 family fimbrial subunit, partial [Odoribacteraceae bacterium]|nr:FimB/Mfa2 family fimbrial subunit [Odoribacteraceae bacterium]
MKRTTITSALNNAKLPGRSRKVESFVINGWKQRERRNLSGERSRFFFACHAIARGAGTTSRGAVALLAVALSLASCIRDFHGNDNIHAGDSTALVTLSLSMPGSPATRVEGTKAENNVNVIDVLLFTTGANDNFYYRAPGKDIQPAADASATEEKKTFTVKLPLGTYNVVVIANARAEIAAVAPAPNTIATTVVSRADILDKIAFSTTGAMATTGFPMWGYLPSVEINENSDKINDLIQLTRAVARVDVSVLDDISAVSGTNIRDKFALTAVYLYNYNRAGSIAPLVASSGGYQAAQWDGSKAIAPHIPDLADLADNASPINQQGPVEYIVDDPATLPRVH